MRKVNKAVSCTNSAQLFAQGVERIVAQKKQHPVNYQDYELESILRKEQALAKETQTEQPSDNLSVDDFLRALTWKNSTNIA